MQHLFASTTGGEEGPVGFASYGSLHVLRGRRSLCGLVFERADIYETPAAGARVWDEFPSLRCVRCDRHAPEALV